MNAVAQVVQVLEDRLGVRDMHRLLGVRDMHHLLGPKVILKQIGQVTFAK